MGLFLSVVSNGCFGQELKRQNIGSLGGSVTASEKVSLQYTVGQPYATTTFSNNETTIRTGFIQTPSYRLSPSKFEVKLAVYPNPVEHTLSVESEFLKGDRLEIVSIQGKVMLTEEISLERSHLDINLSALSGSIYFIQLVRNGQIVSSNKLVKI